MWIRLPLLWTAVTGLLFPQFPEDPAQYLACPNAISLPLNEPQTADISYDKQSDATLLCDAGGIFNAVIRQSEWFVVTGTGNVLTVQTCSPDVETAVTVYQDECITIECTEPLVANFQGQTLEQPCNDRCLASHGHRTACDDQDAMGTRFSWPSVADRTYYLQVWHNVPEFPPVRQSFLSDPPFCGGPVRVQLSESNHTVPMTCGTAQPLLGQSTPDSSTLVSQQQSIPTRAVWYTFRGTGTPVELRVCNAGARIYTGDCETLVDMEDLLQFTDTTCNAIIRLSTTEGLQYYVAASGTSIYDPDFVVQAREIPVTAERNDACDVPQVLELKMTPTTTTFDFDAAATRAPRALGERGPVLWYTFMGTGNHVVLQIAGPEVVSNLYSNDDCALALSHRVSGPVTYEEEGLVEYRFATESNTTYLLALRRSRFADTSPLNFTVWEEDLSSAPPESQCETAVVLEEGDIVTSLSGVEDTRRQVYFRTDGIAMDTYLQVNVCGDESFEVDAFTGSDCSRRRPTAGVFISPLQDSCRTLRLIQEFRSPIVIQIFGYTDTDLELTVSTASLADIPVNNQKPPEFRVSNDQLVELTVNQTVSGTTELATSDAPIFGNGCDLTGQPGLWYALSGSGLDYVACLSGTSGVSSNMVALGQLIDIDAIFEGCLPNAMMVERDGCDLALRFPTAAGAFYSVLIQTEGVFELRLFEEPVLLNGCSPSSPSPTVSPMTQSPVVGEVTATVAPTTSPAVTLAPTKTPAITLAPTTTPRTTVGEETSQSWYWGLGVYYFVVAWFV